MSSLLALFISNIFLNNLKLFRTFASSFIGIAFVQSGGRIIYTGTPFVNTSASAYICRVILLGGFLLALMVPAPSQAIQSPVGCNSNRMNISLTKDKTLVSPGDVITYTVTISNLDNGSFIACDITNANIVFTYPAADGTDTGSTLTLASGANYPAGTPLTTLASVPYTVTVNTGVTDVVAKVELDGDLNDAPSNHSTQLIKTLGTSVQAAAAATPTPSPTSTPTAHLPRLPRTGSR